MAEITETANQHTAIARKGFVSLAMLAIGLPTILVLAAVIVDETRIREAYAQATAALQTAYHQAGRNYSSVVSEWASDLPPPANVICNFNYPAPEEPSNCEIGATSKVTMGSGAAQSYSNVACGVAVDYLIEKSGLFKFVSQDGSHPSAGVRAQFGVATFSGEDHQAAILGSSDADCGRTDIEEYSEDVDGPRVADIADSFGANASSAAFTSAVPAAGEQVLSYEPKWFVGVIGIKVKRYLPFKAIPGAENGYIYTKFIAPLQVVAGFDPS